jgi:hypothetical protein
MHGLFGAELTSFSTVGSAMTTMNRMFLGDVDFDQFQDTDYEESGVNIMAVLGSITLYIVFTMFVSIIDEAYTTQLEIVTKRDEKFDRTESHTYSEKLFNYAQEIQRRASTKVQQRITKAEDELADLTNNNSNIHAATVSSSNVNKTSDKKYAVKERHGTAHN